MSGCFFLKHGVVLWPYYASVDFIIALDMLATLKCFDWHWHWLTVWQWRGQTDRQTGRPWRLLSSPACWPSSCDGSRRSQCRGNWHCWLGEAVQSTVQWRSSQRRRAFRRAPAPTNGHAVRTNSQRRAVPATVHPQRTTITLTHSSVNLNA